MNNKDIDSKLPIYKLTSKDKVLEYYKEWANKENATLVSPSGKINSVDGVFFNQGDMYNQGRIYDFNEDEFISACEEAVKKFEANPLNKEGEKLQTKFTYKKTTDKILDLIKNA